MAERADGGRREDPCGRLGAFTGHGRPGTGCEVHPKVRYPVIMRNPATAKTDFTLKRALDEIEQGHIAPCYLIYGEDGYAVEASLDQIMKKVLPDASNGMNLFTFDGDENIEKLYEEILTPSLLSGTKLIVLRNTALFRSKVSAADSFRKAVDALDQDPGRALRYFHNFMKIAGLNADDLANDNWKNVPEKDWRKLLGEDYSDMMKLVSVLARLAAESNLTPEAGQGSAEDVSELLKKGFPDGNILIMTADSVDQRKNVYKVIAEHGIVITRTPPKYEKGKAASFVNAVRENIAHKGKRITPDAISALGKKTENDIRTALSELDKLVTYTGGRDLIDVNDVEEIAGKSSMESAFKLNACILEKDIKGSLDVLNDLLINNEPVLKILALIIREFRLLLQAKILLNAGIVESIKPGLDYGGFQSGAYHEIKSAAQRGRFLGEIAGQHPYVIYSSIRNSSRFSYEKLLDNLKYLLEMDIAFKSSRIDQRIALESVLVRLCS